MKIFALLALALAEVVVAAPTQTVEARAQIDGAAPKIDDPHFISTVMDAHFYWRRIHCAQDLQWNHTIAQAALDDVSECPQEQEHKRGGSNLSSVGPSPGQDYDVWINFTRTAIHGWHEEEVHYAYGPGGWNEAAGHFTQLVWRDSSQIGCALAHCSDNVGHPGRIYCYYENAGNNIAGNAFQENVWPPVCLGPTKVEAKAQFGY